MHHQRTNRHTQASGARGRPSSGVRLSAVIMVPVLITLTVLTLFTAGCREEKQDGEFKVGVFVPGFTEGSPIYEMLAAGAREAVEDDPLASAEVVEGGYNQALWQEKVTSLAATGSYDLILTSNPAMPAVCAEVARDFPDQAFAVMDGYLADHPQIYTVLFNQVEQAYLIGYLAGLVTTGAMPGANPRAGVGMIVGQQYPVMDRAIRPGFERGLREAAPSAELDFRVVGNWHDAGKAAELAQSMFDAGIDVVLPIAGGAGLGVLKVAEENGRYVLWFDSSGYSLAPGTVVGSTVLKNDRAARETVELAMDGKLPLGEARIVGVEQGYIDFVDDDPLYERHVPETIRREMQRVLDRFSSGALSLSMPEL